VLRIAKQLLRQPGAADVNTGRAGDTTAKIGRLHIGRGALRTADVRLGLFDECDLGKPRRHVRRRLFAAGQSTRTHLINPAAFGRPGIPPRGVAE
jgi:hypothetical protein